MRLVACVDYANGQISALRVRELPTGDWQTISRSQALDELRRGVPYLTYALERSMYRRGPQVQIVRVAGAEFLKAAVDAIPEDNLGKLPGMKACPF